MGDFKSFQGKNNGSFEQEAKKVAARCNGRSENDMLKEIYARALEGKKNGTLSNEQIDAFYKQFSPMLDGAKRKKLQKIVEQLKSM